MDYSTGLLIISTNLSVFLASIYYCNYKFNIYRQDIINCKMVDEVLHTKIINLKDDIERIEEFKTRLVEKNIAILGNRDWDKYDDEDEDDDEDY